MHRDENERIPEWEEMASVACSVQNIYLSLAAAGLGGYWSTPSYLIENASNYFDMHEREQCMGLFYVGVPILELPEKVLKRPIDEKLKWY
jgi:nitroreductase